MGKERVVFSQEQMLSSLNSALKELGAFQYDRRFREALGEGFVDKAFSWEENIHAQQEKPFTLVVIGDFKRGKSTLINALLGEEVVTSDVTTETVTLNRLSYGPSGNEAVLSGNKRAILTNEELKRESLEKVIQELGEDVEWLELKRPNEFLKQVCIIDTPGTGDAMKDFSDVVQRSLLQADAVIYVYNIQYPLSRTEQIFLKSAVLPQKYTDLLLVGNFTDILSTKEEYDRLRVFLKNRMEGFLPNTEVYMVSALDALCRATGEEVEETEVMPILREQFDKLRGDLQGLVEERADTVLVSRMQRLVGAMLVELNQIIGAIEKGLQLNEEEAENVRRAAEERRMAEADGQEQKIKELCATVKSMKQETMVWMKDFLFRLAEECQTLQKYPVEDIKVYFEFYCVDLLQKAMDTCIDYHEDRLYEIMEELSDGVGSKWSDILPEQRGYQFRLNLDNRIWTKGDTVGLVTNQIAGVGLLGNIASLVSDGIAGTMRKKEEDNRAQELYDQISKKMLGLEALVSQTIEQQYGELAKSAEKAMLACFKEEEERKSELEEQTLQAAKKNAEQRNETKKVLEEARTVLDRISANITV